MQSEYSIRAAATELDVALEAGDVDRAVACFAPECTIELLGVRLDGHDGVRRWLAWVYDHVDRIEFRPRLISVDGDTLIEEFGVTGTSSDGRRLHGRWAELLTYRDDLVTSLRLYFDPLEFAPALGLLGRLAGPPAKWLTRRGLEPYQTIETTP